MRKVFVYRDGEMIEKGTEADKPGLTILHDIKPYRSMITGEMITSRSTHRRHLRQHGMVEVGNDSSLRKPYTGMPDANPKQRKEILRREVDKFTHDEWVKAGQRELERLKYTTRGIPER